MTLRAMVVDDEPLAVERMCALLARIPDIAVVATAEPELEPPGTSVGSMAFFGTG